MGLVSEARCTGNFFEFYGGKKRRSEKLMIRIVKMWKEYQVNKWNVTWSLLLKWWWNPYWYTNGK